MFNKSGSNPNDASADSTKERPAPRGSQAPAGQALVGASIHMDGRIFGEEDLLIEGKVTGTVELKQNTVTVGSKGHVGADLYGRHIVLEGKVEGNVFASESIVVRKSAHVTGRLVAPAVSLEQGGYFSGTVEMDADTEELKKAFGQSLPKSVPSAPKPIDENPSVATLAQSAKK